MAHYIYDAQLRGEKLSLEDAITMSRLPVIGDRADDDGAIWMEPQAGLAVILKGQASFARPIVLQTFYPAVTPGAAPTAARGILESTYNNTLTIIDVARRVESMLESLSSNITMLGGAIERLLNQQSTILGEAQTLNARLAGLNETCSSALGRLKTQQAMLAEIAKNLNQEINSLNETAGRACNRVNSRLGRIIGLEAVLLVLLIASIAISAYTLAKTARRA